MKNPSFLALGLLLALSATTSFADPVSDALAVMSSNNHDWAALKTGMTPAAVKWAAKKNKGEMLVLDGQGHLATKGGKSSARKNEGAFSVRATGNEGAVLAISIEIQETPVEPKEIKGGVLRKLPTKCITEMAGDPVAFEFISSKEGAQKVYASYALSEGSRITTNFWALYSTKDDLKKNIKSFGCSMS